MLLRNPIRPHPNRKLLSPTRLTRININLPRIIPNTKITAKTIPNRRPEPIPRMPIRLHPLRSRTGSHTINRHPHPRRHRRRHRRLQPHSPPTTAALIHRSNRITRRIHQTQRNRRLRPHHNPPPRRQHPRQQQHNQPHPPQHNQTPQKPTHLQPPAESPAAPASTAHKPPTRANRLQHIPQCYPPPD